jgi:hypothetical protein
MELPALNTTVYTALSVFKIVFFYQHSQITEADDIIGAEETYHKCL